MKATSQNILTNWHSREQTSGLNRRFERQFYVNFSLAKRLGLEKELQGHDGCVNCLQWSDDGSFLLSGSDDFKIILWDMVRRKSNAIIQSGHQGNIFAVKFLPYSSSNTISSAAGDATVRICSTATSECTHVYKCHDQRVKRLAVSSDAPFLLWSGSEDGTVRQYDLRESHQCQTGSACNNSLINFKGLTKVVTEVKCIQIHPLYSQYLAVGCNDPYVRLYDRRMLSLTDIKLEIPPSHVARFAPGHISSQTGKAMKGKRPKHFATTYINFSPDGQELIQNLGGEHIYIYDMNEHRTPLKFLSGNHTHYSSYPLQTCVRTASSKNSCDGLNSTYEMRNTNGFCKKEPGNASQELSELAMKLKLQGNDSFSQQNYFQAVVCYNRALRLVPDSSVLYANRAAALLKRAWNGDIYAALRDSFVAVALDPTHSKAYYRQARCLYELKWYDEAYDCLQRFKDLFPQQAEGHSFVSLEAEISRRLSNSMENQETSNKNKATSLLRTESPESRLLTTDVYKNSYDYDARFVGACNTTTDIKEATFFGSNGQYIVAGSDCGCMLLWERETTNLIEAWQGDESIVNCVQPHPSACLIATSGIDHVVRLWSPRSIEDSMNDGRGKEVEGLVQNNQKRMNIDPLVETLRAMRYRVVMDSNRNQDNSEDQNQSNDTVECLTS